MYDEKTREWVRTLRSTGMSKRAVSIHTGVNRATIRDWELRPDGLRSTGSCFVCLAAPCPLPETYAYLLGQYLGDGYLVTSARVPKLRVACAQSYPAIAREVDAAMTALSGGNISGHVVGVGCDDHYNYWMHWPCLLPQHGPGPKHTRPIVLAAWQRAIVDDNPWPLIRGLIHSDGYRGINRVVVRGVRYGYPRYLFSNTSTDILAIMGEALDCAGVEWRFNRPDSISVAKRAAVAAMDAHIGPKS